MPVCTHTINGFVVCMRRRIHACVYTHYQRLRGLYEEEDTCLCVHTLSTAADAARDCRIAAAIYPWWALRRRA
jgi:hypothetical protein